MAKSILYYKWEFLRRNESYINDFKTKISNNNKVIVASDMPKGVYRYFSKNYNIYYPINPSYSYGALVKWFYRNKHTQKGGLLYNSLLLLGAYKPKNRSYSAIFPISSKVSQTLVGTDDISFVKFSKKDISPAKCTEILNKNGSVTFNFNKIDLSNIDFSRIEITIDLALSERRIIKEVNKEILKWKRLYDKYYPHKTRTRYDMYDTYLTIYKLWKQNKTYIEIVKIVYPNEYKNEVKKGGRNKYDFLKLTQRVKNNLDACKKIIKEGYKTIR